MTHHTEPGITVTGTGQTAAAPDLMTVDLGVSVLASTVAEGRSLVAGRAGDLLASMRENGLTDKDIQTIRYTIHPEYDHHEGRQTLRGYRVSNVVRASLRDLSTSGEFLDAATGAGGDEVTIENISFSLQDETTVRDQAREAAWADARARAEHLARLSDQTLGDVVEIVETTGRPPGPGPMPRMAMAADTATPIEAGTTAITVTLQVRFGLA